MRGALIYADDIQLLKAVESNLKEDVYVNVWIQKYRFIGKSENPVDYIT